MSIKLNLTKGFLLLFAVIGIWLLVTIVANLTIHPRQDVNIPTGSGSIKSGSGSSSQFSSEAKNFKKVTIIDEEQSLPINLESSEIFPYLKSHNLLRKISITGTDVRGKIRIVVSTKDPKAVFPHDPLIGVGLILINPNDGKSILKGNFLESQWIGNGTHHLSPSKSTGLLQAGQTRIYEYDFSQIPLSQDTDAKTNSFPAGIKNFDLVDAIKDIKDKPALLGIYTSQLGFGLIESAEITYEGKNDFVVTK